MPTETIPDYRNPELARKLVEDFRKLFDGTHALPVEMEKQNALTRKVDALQREAMAAKDEMMASKVYDSKIADGVEAKFAKVTALLGSAEAYQLKIAKMSDEYKQSVVANAGELVKVAAFWIPGRGTIFAAVQRHFRSNRNSSSLIVEGYPFIDVVRSRLAELEVAIASANPKAGGAARGNSGETCNMAALRDLTGLDNKTVGKYAALAGVSRPGRGKRNHLFTDAEVTKTLQKIAELSTEDATKRKCAEALEKRNQIAIKS